MEKAYILAWWRNGLELIGPFDDEDAAAKWASTTDGHNVIANPNNPYDTPCWQVITLNTTQFIADMFPLRVRVQSSGPLRDFV